MSLARSTFLLLVHGFEIYNFSHKNVQKFYFPKWKTADSIFRPKLLMIWPASEAMRLPKPCQIITGSGARIRTWDQSLNRRSLYR